MREVIFGRILHISADIPYIQFCTVHFKIVRYHTCVRLAPERKRRSERDPVGSSAYFQVEQLPVRASHHCLEHAEHTHIEHPLSDVDRYIFGERLLGVDSEHNGNIAHYFVCFVGYHPELFKKIHRRCVRSSVVYYCGDFCQNFDITL